MKTAFRDFLNTNKIYKYNEIPEVLKNVRPYFRFAFKNKNLKYFNVPCAFDIETTSFSERLENEIEYTAIMYEWTFGIFGAIIVGRTWEEFLYMLEALQNALDLNISKRLIIYVHNLAFEFQFIRLRLKWHKVFAIDNRKPVYAITENGFEFRCSYILSGYSLENLAKNIEIVKIEKKTGFLDYTKKRHSKTLLTDDEILYCVYDVKIVLAYIMEQIERNNNIVGIPLTKTGYVRRYVKKECFKNPDYRKYINKLTLNVDEYKQLKRAFQGGFTHCNPFFSGKVINDVTSFDFTSSYPAVMIAEEFPCSRAETVEIKSKAELLKNLRLYCCLFDIEFTGLESKLFCDNYISISRCQIARKAVVNNGRVVSADVIKTTVTEQDYLIILQFYTWKKARITNFRRYKKGYLPKEFINAILTLYENKTKLKGVEGEEVNYMVSKEMLNSCYGMTVTDIVRNEFIYENDKWLDDDEKPPLDYEAQINKYNTNRGRFMFYCFGVWVTAYARRNLFTAIVEFNEDYIYSDTDSVKVRNAEKHTDYINRYNEMITEKLYKTLDFYKIPRKRVSPETVNGIKKPLGVWDYDGFYKRFKSLGAKRYLVEYPNGEYKLTVSGLNKDIVIPYLKKKYKNVFNAFSDKLYIPAGKTGKMTHRYIDQTRTGVLRDYKGKYAPYEELSAVHLENADYSLSLSREYVDFIKSLK